MSDGRHLITGEWFDNAAHFRAKLVQGDGPSYPEAGLEEVDRALKAAEAAFAVYGQTTREERAAFIERIAVEIEVRGARLTETAMAESGLPQARLEGERGRTTGQLKLFAAHIRDGAYLDRRHDAALPDRQPLPRPELRMMQMPLGPVAVFGASNFPLAFSTAGGDTASALAAGCPVVVKGHPAHPGTGQIVAEAILAAIEACGMPKGVFSLLHGSTNTLGAAVVEHPLTRAVGFTGSLGAGRALFDLCAKRPEPIPFFGELGSVNPVFLMPEAMKARAEAIAKGWAGSLTMGAGQFCTNPGIAIAIKGAEAETFARVATEALAESPAQTMLTDGIAAAFRKGQERVSATAGVQALLHTVCAERSVTPSLYRVSGAEWKANAALGHEVFGPLGILVTVESLEEMAEIAAGLEGQLTCTLQLDAGDVGAAQRLMPILARKAGRVLANGFPTGVEVADAMVHGGPYPASTNFGATSVGTMAIRRWLRPVCFQNLPEALLPADLQG